MKLNIETKLNIFDEVKYKKVDVFSIFDNKEPKEIIKKSRVYTIDIQVGSYGDIHISYGMENGDVVSSECILDAV